MHFRIEAPASTSNLGPGFDCLGLALDLALAVEFDICAAGLEIEVHGESAAQLSRGADNLVVTSCARILERAGRPMPGLRLRVDNAIPVARGLGSSAAAIACGVLAAHHVLDGPRLDRQRALQDAATIEGHPDNVSPCLLGGFVASAWSEDGALCSVPLAFPPGLDIVLVVPERQVPTPAARARLPTTVSFVDAVFGLSRLALLLGALQQSNLGLLRAGLADRMHQPHRLPLVPGLERALAALDGEPGCVGAALSGSGPTLLGFFSGVAAGAGHTAVAALAAAGVPARILRTRTAPHGARIETLPPTQKP